LQAAGKPENHSKIAIIIKVAISETAISKIAISSAHPPFFDLWQFLHT